MYLTKINYHQLKKNTIMRGALFQDNSFEFKDFNGLPLEEFIVCEDSNNHDIIMAFIKVKQKEWHQFFLDSGYGFWQNYVGIDGKNEMMLDDEYAYHNKGMELNLIDKKISRIWCEPEYNNSKISIVFEDGNKVTLKTIKATVFDSESELIFEAV